jgi:uncharacterized protein YyaL (SSP411 family)
LNIRKILQKRKYSFYDTLLFSYRESKVYGFLDDYAYVIQACIDLYENNLDDELLIFAYDLQKQQDEFFWDSNKKRYLSTDGKDSSIILRLSEGTKKINKLFISK